MADQLATLRRFHALISTVSPQEVQTNLYNSFPNALGFSSKLKDPAMFEAVLVLALAQASKGAGDSELHKVYFFAPADLADGWLLAEFRDSAKRIFSRLKAGRSVAAVKHVGELFHQIMFGSQVFAVPREPERWVAFGFSHEDPVPEWLRDKLLKPAETGRDVSPGV